MSVAFAASTKPIETKRNIGWTRLRMNVSYKRHLSEKCFLLLKNILQIDI